MAGIADNHSTPWMILDEAVEHLKQRNGGVEILACHDLVTTCAKGDCPSKARGFDGYGRYRERDLKEKFWRRHRVTREVRKQRNPKTGAMEVVVDGFVLKENRHPFKTVEIG